MANVSITVFPLKKTPVRRVEPGGNLKTTKGGELSISDTYIRGQELFSLCDAAKRFAAKLLLEFSRGWIPCVAISGPGYPPWQSRLARHPASLGPASADPDAPLAVPGEDALVGDPAMNVTSVIVSSTRRHAMIKSTIVIILALSMFYLASGSRDFMTGIRAIHAAQIERAVDGR